MDYEYAEFYENAMALFRISGHTANNTPITANRTFKQMVYFDSEKTIFVDKSMLKSANNISHLFDLTDDCFDVETGSAISFYSVELNCLKQNRSSTAHDVHAILHSTLSVDTSIVLFKHDEEVIISIAGVEGNVILSDWYDLFFDFDRLIDNLNVGHFSYSTSHEFVKDLVYMVARYYYLEPALEGLAIYSLIPINYYGSGLVKSEQVEVVSPVKQFLEKIIQDKESKYGDDYVEFKQGTIRDMSAIDDELVRLSFELELQEESSSDNGDSDDYGNAERDEYEYDDVDESVFDDPTAMIAWLNSNSLHDESLDFMKKACTTAEEKLADNEDRKTEEVLLNEEDRQTEMALQARIDNDLEVQKTEMRRAHWEEVCREITDARIDYVSAEKEKLTNRFVTRKQELIADFQRREKYIQEQIAEDSRKIEIIQSEIAKLLVIQFIKKNTLEKELQQSYNLITEHKNELHVTKANFAYSTKKLEKQYNMLLQELNKKAENLFPLPEMPIVNR